MAHVEFLGRPLRRRLQGYDPGDADTLLRQANERQAELEQEVQSLNAENTRLQSEVGRHYAAETSVSRALVLAQEAAGQAKAEAERKATEILDLAHHDARGIMEQAREEARRIVGEAYDRAHAVTAEAADSVEIAHLALSEIRSSIRAVVTSGLTLVQTLSVQLTEQARRAGVGAGLEPETASRVPAQPIGIKAKAPLITEVPVSFPEPGFLIEVAPLPDASSKVASGSEAVLTAGSPIQPQAPKEDTGALEADSLQDVFDDLVTGRAAVLEASNSVSSESEPALLDPEVQPAPFAYQAPFEDPVPTFGVPPEPLSFEGGSEEPELSAPEAPIVGFEPLPEVEESSVVSEGLELEALAPEAPVQSEPDVDGLVVGEAQKGVSVKKEPRFPWLGFLKK